MISKKALAISILIVFLVGTVSSTLLPASAQKDYCPQSVEKKYCHKVIIIGAGIAGLGAAVELRTHGYDDFIVLEATSIPGGRVATWHSSINGADVIYDTHASLISGTVGNPITDLAHKYNIDISQTDYKNATYFDEDGLITNKTRIEYLSDLDPDFVSQVKDRRQYIIQNKLPDESLQNMIDSYSSSQNFTPNQTKDFLFGISSYIGNEWASDPVNLSLFYNITGYRVGGEDPDVTDSVFPKGFRQIIDGLVNDTGNKNIQYNTLVKQVNYTDQGVTVKTINSTGTYYYYGKYLISTLPINVLQGVPQTIEFNPSLPPNKINTINKMEMGTLGQTYLYFKNGIFWNNTDFIYYVPPLNETGHWIAFENMYKVNGKPVLLAFNYGKYAIQLLTKTDNQIKNEVLKVLSHMYPGKVSTSDIDIAYRGETPSYSTNPVGLSVPDDFNQLANPLPDNGTKRIFFAGEATTWHYPATTTGSFLTGLREANRVMVTDKGKYEPPLVQGKTWRFPAKSDTDKYSDWKTFPEYVICKPGFALLAKPDLSPICVNPDHAKRLVQSKFALDPSLP